VKIRFENVDFNSSSGPNSFAAKLKKYLERSGHRIAWHNYDSVLCFIETRNDFEGKRLFQRLDGIYFNTEQDYKQQNANILKTYKRADGVIFQSNFNKKLITKYFGEHKNSIVIHNGADLELIEKIKPIRNEILDEYENIWSCASSWRPHKRLKENINYFLEHKGNNDCLIVAGPTKEKINDPNIFYAGNLPYEKLLSLYKSSKYFIHLAWLDHCPNVVVDARASGCQIICSGAGGTKEVAGPNAAIIEEEEWDFKPVKLYEPPKLDFSNKAENHFDISYNMVEVTKQYIGFINERE
jgi:glycosyltransferase involved in cell wall biosynthesis